MHLVNIPISSSAKLYLGQAPGNSFLFVDEVKEVEALASAHKVDYVVVLQTLDELNWSVPGLFDIYYDAGIQVIHYPIQDMQTPRSLESLDRLVDAVLKLLMHNKNVLIHCFGGKGRTGLVAAAILIKSKKAPATGAVQYLRKLRPGAVETAAQFRFLVNYERMVRNAAR